MYPGQIIDLGQISGDSRMQSIYTSSGSRMQSIYTSSGSYICGGLGNLLGGIGGGGLTNVPLQSVVYQLPYQPIVHKEPEIPAKPKSVSGTALELIEKLSRQEKFVAGEKMVCEERTLAAVDLCHF